MAGAALVLAGLFALLTLFSGFQWLDTKSQVADVADKPLVEALGVEIPDPRPAVERTMLRMQALVWGAATAGAATFTLLFSAVYLVARPDAALRPRHRTPAAPDG